MGKIFTGENEVGLEEVLANRDYRRKIIEETMARNPEEPVLSYKLNIPGPEKNNQGLGKLFDKGLADIIKTIEKSSRSYKILEVWDKNTGKEGVFLVGTDGKALKKAMVDLEEESDLTRLYDIDISYKNKDISRQDIGRPGRKCFICQGPVSLCARSRKHSVKEMQNHIEKILDENF